MTTEFRVLGLSGRDGVSDEELFVSSAEVGDEGAELAVVFEAAGAARAVNTRGSIHGFKIKMR